MHKVTCDYWKHVAAGETVTDGFNNDITAPAEPGYYTLYELVEDGNTHAGFEWEKEV